MLEIKGFCKAYQKGKFVVKNLNLFVAPKDIYGFIGHNGAGKTTTLKAIAGIITYDSGEIIIDGVSLKKEPILCKQKMAFVMDNPELYDYLTGIKYLEFISNICQIDVKTRKERINYYAKGLEVYDNLGQLISSYSHGMKQKLALVAAFMRKPKLLILDEPFVGLDPKASHTLKEFMKELAMEGSSIIFSTHVLEVAEKLCNKVAIIREGSIIIDGEIEEVKKNKTLEEIFLDIYDDTVKK